MLTIATKTKLAFLLAAALTMSAVAGGMSRPAMVEASHQAEVTVIEASGIQDLALAY